jgi:hemerythrin-like domain-containing protein
MKRSEQLKKLSWEHHDALKFARHIRKGLEKGRVPELIAAYALHVTERFLEPHFLLEEHALVSRLTDEQRSELVVQQVLEEHRQFGVMKGQLRQKGAEQVLLLEQFISLLKAHVNLEEKRFFPFIERTLGPEALEQAGAEIDRGHITGNLDWEQRFWV